MITAWLLKRMQNWHDQLAMACAAQRVTYGELLERIAEWRVYFDTHRIGPGQIVVIRADFTPSACALLLALSEHGAITVPLTMQTVSQHEDYFAASGAEVILTQPDSAGVAAAPQTERWHRETRRGQTPHPLVERLRSDGSPGLIAFTSGSTGKPKAILHNLAQFMDTYREQRRSMCTITFLSFDHLGGVNTLLYVFSSGGTMIPLAARDPETVCRAIETYRVELLPTSPTFLKLLLISQVYKRYDLSSLKLVTYGTEVMPESTLQQLRATFPQVRLQQTYAFSEGPPLRLKAKEPGSLWIKLGSDGVETKVVDGQLWVRAQASMMGYLNAPNPFSEDGWFNTGDMVEVDGEYVRIFGRKSEMINVGGEKVFPAEIENVILQVDNIQGVVVRGKPNPVVGNIVLATVTIGQPEDAATVEKRVRSFCQARLPAFKVPAIVRVTAQPLHSDRFKQIRTAN